MDSSSVRRWLSHPLTRGLDLDDPRTTEIRRRVIAEKPFLREIYTEWYESIARALPAGREPVLEIGSGAGFLSEFVPHLLTSEVLPCKGVSIILDARQLPFSTGALKGIVMTNVLHHIPQPRRFFADAARAVRPGGVMTMVEPWRTAWSSFVYEQLHHEPFDSSVSAWEFPPAGPLSGANGALPWIIFERDRAAFAREFPEWSIDQIRLILPFRYLLSGGVSMRSLVPNASGPVWRLIERRLQPWISTWAMFAEIRLLRVPDLSSSAARRRE